MASDATVSGPFESFTHEGLTISSNSETAEDIKANLTESAEKPLDGEEPDPEKEEAARVSKAASELGRKGGQAAAEKRAKAGENDALEGEEEQPKAKEKPLGKPRDDPRARMLEATRKESEAKKLLATERQERERLAAENRELRAAHEARQREQPAAPKLERPTLPEDPSDPRPYETDPRFKTYEDFVEARARWAARQEFSERRREAERQFMASARDQHIVGAIGAFNKRLDDAGDSFRDQIAPEVLALQPSFTMRPGERPTALTCIADELISSEHAPALMLHLSEHPEDLQRIAALSNSRDVSREMAKLEGRVSAAPAGNSERPATSSKAKPPVRPVTGSPTPASDDVDDDTPFEVHFRKMNARDKSRGRGHAN